MRTDVVPAVRWLRGYDRRWLAADVLAGTTTAAVVVPQAMAYGTVAGLPVQVGLYTCIAPMLVYVVLGGARRMSLSTTSTIVALVGLALTSVGVEGGPEDRLAAATTLTLMVGLVLWVARVVRLGFLVECVSEAVVVGLKLGVGLTIAVSQLPALLGVAGGDGGFASDVAAVVRNLGDANRPTVVISAVTLAGLLVVRRWARVPGPLLAVVGGIVAVAALGLGDDGVSLVPEVPRGLPLPALPPLEHVGPLLPYAAAIGLMAYLESVTVARSTRAPDDPPLDNGGELVAVGAASVVGSFLQAAPAAGGFSQTLVNQAAGARTQLSEVVTAAWAVVTALALAPLLKDLPRATLAAVVLLAVSGLLRPAELRRLARIDPVEAYVAVATGLVALATDLLVGVLVGVFLTFWLVLRALNHPLVVELPGRPGLLVLRIEGGLYTANVRSVADELRRRTEAAGARVLVLDLDATGDTSVTVLDTLAELARDLASQGTALWVAALPGRALAKARRTVRWDELAAAGRVHPTVAAAVAAYDASARGDGAVGLDGEGDLGQPGQEGAETEDQRQHDDRGGRPGERQDAEDT